MSIFDAFSTKPAVQVRSGTQSMIQQINALFRSALSAEVGYPQMTEKRALTVSSVYSAVKLLSEIPASLPLQLRKRQGDSDYFELVNDSPLAITLRIPNEYNTSFNFQQPMLAKMLLRGNSYAFIKRNPDGTKEMIPVYTEDTKMFVSPDGLETYYEINGVPFQNYEIIHYRGMSLDGFLGLSPIHYAARTITNAIDAERYVSKVYESGIISSGFFTTAEKLTEKTYERMKQSIKDRSGIDRAGEAQILEQGLRFERNTLTAADTEIIDQMGFSVEEICRIYRVPKHLLFLDSKGGSTRSFATQAMEFLTYSLTPILDNIQQELESKLLTTDEYKSGDYRIAFDTQELLRVNPTERSAYYKDLFNIGSLTPNEIRAFENLPPVDGGDQTFVQLNLAPADMIDEIIQDKINKQIDSTNG